jgi:hypothetical protein
MRIQSYAVLVAVAAVAIGCGGGKGNKNANQPVQCPPGQVFDGQYCVMAQPAAPPTTAPSPTTPTAPPTAAPTTQPQQGPGPVDQLPGLVQAHVASGAQPLGNPATGTVGGGQQIEVPVQANPGQCYTAVAAGGPGVQELEVTMEYVSPVPGTSPVLAVDKDQGPTAVMAPQPNCYKWALPMGAPVKVVVKATAGAGQAAVQVFVK